MKPRWWVYVVPIFLVTIATFLVTMIPALKQKTSLLPFLAAVVVAAWFGGMIPSLISAFLSAVAWSYFIVEPANTFKLTEDDFIRLLLFIFLAVMVSSLYVARERAQRRAEASERRLSVAMEAARLAIWEYDVPTSRFWTSWGFSDIWPGANGVRIDSLAKLQGMVHSDDRASFIETATRAIEQGEPFDITHRVAGGNSQIRTVGRVHKDHKGKIVKVVGVVVATGATET